MQTALRFAAAAIFIAWIIATVLFQLNYTWLDKLKEFDVLRLLPRWTFFAPNPCTTDFHVVYRLKSLDGTVSEFLEIPLHRREWYAFFWNARKRLRKSVIDLAITMNQLCASTEYTENNIRLTFSYLAILNFLKRVPRDSDTAAIQFALLSTNGFIDAEAPKLIICSEFHRV